MLSSKESIEKVLQEIVDKFLIPKFKELGMNASGRWIDSLEVEFDGKNGYIKGEDYTQYLAQGREGGTLPPINAIEQWVNIKLGLSGQEARNMAWAVAKKIQREGTDYYPNGTDLLEILQSKEVIDYFNFRVGEIEIEMIRIEFERNINDLMQ